MFIVFLKDVDSPPIKSGRAGEGCEMEDKYARQLIAEGFAEEVSPDLPDDGVPHLSVTAEEPIKKPLKKRRIKNGTGPTAEKTSSVKQT